MVTLCYHHNSAEPLRLISGQTRKKWSRVVKSLVSLPVRLAARREVWLHSKLEVHPTSYRPTSWPIGCPWRQAALSLTTLHSLTCSLRQIHWR